MNCDQIETLLDQWSHQRPDLNTESLGIVVRIMHLSKDLTERANSALESIDLTHWEYDVLSVLARQQKPYCLSPTELAEQTKTSTGAMTNRLDRLEQRKLLKRSVNQKDRRGIQIHLTSAGVELINTAVELRLEAAENSLSELNLRKRRNLEQMLKTMMAAKATSAGSLSPIQRL